MSPRALLDFSLKRQVPHQVVAGLTMLLGVFLIALGIAGSDQVEANRISLPVAAIAAPVKAVAATAPAAAPAPAPVPQWHELQVRRGDNLSLIFGRMGLRSDDLQAVLDAATKSRSLRDIFPGQTVSFQIGTAGELLSMRFARTPLEASVFERGEAGFSVRDEIREPEIRHAFRHAVLETSLFDAAHDAGVPVPLIMEMANVLGGVMDFALDPRDGDTFSVLFEEKYLDGEKIGDGAIIAVEYINDSKPLSAYRFVDGNGDTGYFSADGVSMRKAFLRAPLDFMRVSSNFSLRRLHPVAKVFRPHRGTDYSAPTGTPVYASGDGRVVASAYSRSNGNFVFVQHANDIVTHYLHLHKRTVKVGERVKQGQTIGTVGATGLATGPHLHYEFLVNGAHRDPRTVLDKLPRARALAKEEFARFQTGIAPLQSQLASYTKAWEIAMASSSENAR